MKFANLQQKKNLKKKKKIADLKFANFVCIIFAPHLGRKWCIFPCIIQNNTKFANFVGLYIFLILQQFATNLCNVTNFKMLFLAVLMDFVFLA
jgi:hypothetical protein